MNFKKYHVSKNLFDKDNTTIYNAYLAVDSESSIWITSEDSRSVKMPCKPNTQYTLSISSAIPIFRICSSSNANIEPSGGGVRVKTIIRSENIQQYTFTTSADDACIIFQGSASLVNEWFNSLMLNEGATALPYEPYSSEVWHDIPHYIHNTSTDTLTTLPADIYANDTTATVGLKGNMEQSGTPTPTTPIQPQECGDMSSNLFDITAFVQGIVPNKCTTSYDSTTNTLTINATGDDAHTGNANPYHIPVTGGETYTLRWSTNSLLGSVYIFENGLTDSAHLHYWNASLLKGTVTMRSDTTYIVVRLGCSLSNTSKTYTNVMLNVGGTALPYEPYGQYKIPILSGGTTTPVYLGEVESTRNIKKYICTGNETVDKIANNIYYLSGALISDAPILGISAICTHYENNPVTTGISANLLNGQFTINQVGIGNYSITIHDDINGGNVSAQYKQYLAQQYANGTPVCVWYILATPQTAVVNEPLRKIGNYADTVSGITIPTIAGANTLSVGTTLQPSEVTATYKGWHPVADVHEHENGAWD